jgi:ATP-dependent RNA helicase DeaD
LVARDEKFRLKSIENYTKVKIEKGVIPSYEDIVGVRKARFVESISATIQEGDTDLYEDVLEMLRHSGFTTEQIVAALAKQIMGVQKNEYSDSNLAWEERRGDGRREGGSDRFERRSSGGSTGGRFDRGSRDGGSREGDRRGPSSDRFASRERSGESRAPRERDGEAKRTAAPEAGMTRLFLSLGRKDHIMPRDIVGAIAGEANIPVKTIGAIDIYDKFTFVDVPERDARTVLRAMDGNTIKGKAVQIDIAK